MQDFLTRFALCFIPMFVAVDPLGLLPIYVSVTGDYGAARRRKLVYQAMPMALAIGVLFFLVGGVLLKTIGILLVDLQIAGGSILFVFALLDLVITGKPSVQEESSVGIVPLATPLIVGPAVLTLGLVLVETYGYDAALAALVVNLAIVTVMLLGIERVLRYLPMNTMKAISKVLMLLLAAIGVALIRQGIVAVVQNPRV